MVVENIIHGIVEHQYKMKADELAHSVTSSFHMTTIMSVQRASDTADDALNAPWLMRNYSESDRVVDAIEMKGFEITSKDVGMKSENTITIVGGLSGIM